jgi:RNA polymerase sigma-70 factor (ECF subfamily)
MALSSDDRLVRKAREGDREAFEALVSRYQRPAYLAALGVTGRHEDAEDVAQESFIVALERLEECRDPSRFAGWFLTIVRNRARNYIRRESLRRMEEIPVGTASQRPDPARDLESGELKEALSRAMEGLSEVRRQVVLMHDLEGWKHREIGEVLGIPPGTVRSHLHFARKALREALERSGGELESSEP